MITGPLQLYDQSLVALLDGSRKLLDEAKLTALLLNATYVPDLSAHATLADVSGFEIAGGDYHRRSVTGGAIQAATGVAAFTSDAISWGDPVTLPPAKYLAICYGALGTLAPESPLLGVMDLAGSAPSVEAVRSSFRVTPPASGWFTLSRAA
ncbi:MULTISPECIES: hypothetical protein [Kordiimonas]|jgi:hypothetical protein|uniref:hypothetical protein n=1 Tax=Kordiimonas TaxID=288021 RepID=UPI00257F2A81|nr:hypothetical protein [Kordiimonas sp. UBA4487]